MKKRTNRNIKKQKAKRNSKRKTRKFSKKYNSCGGSILWKTKYGYQLYDGPLPIVMEPIILFKSTRDTDEQCNQIKQLMSANKTFVRVPQSIEHLTNNDFVETHNPEGVSCGFSSLLIPGWYETYRLLKIAELYIRETDGDTIDSGCGFENYIWLADALGHIEKYITTVAMYDAIMGLSFQGILLSSFMEYIYDPKNEILNETEKRKYMVYYNDRQLEVGKFVSKYNKPGKSRDNMISELVKSCFKTYSQFVKFVTTIQRHKTSVFGRTTPYDTIYKYGDPISYEDSQQMCMNVCYTETLLPEQRKLVGLYIHSRNCGFYRTTDTAYDSYMADAITKAKELNITLYSLRGQLPPP